MKENNEDMIGTRLHLNLPSTEPVIFLSGDSKLIGTRLHLNLPPTEPIIFTSNNPRPKVLSKTKKIK